MKWIKILWVFFVIITERPPTGTRLSIAVCLWGTRHNNYCCCCQAFEGIFHQGLSCLLLEDTELASCLFVCVGCETPSNDPFCLFHGPFVRSSFFVLSCWWVVGSGIRPKMLLFLHTQKTRSEPQFFLGVAACASAELREPAWMGYLSYICLLYTSDAADE